MTVCIKAMSITDTFSIALNRHECSIRRICLNIYPGLTSYGIVWLGL